MAGAMAGSRMHDDGRGDGSLGTQGSATGRSRADSKAARRGAAAEHRQGDGAQQGSATGRSSRQQGSATGRSSRARAQAAAAAGHDEVEAVAGHAQRYAGRYIGLGRGGWTAIRKAIRRAIRRTWTRRLDAATGLRRGGLDATTAAGHAQRYAGLGRGGWTAIRQDEGGVTRANLAEQRQGEDEDDTTSGRPPGAQGSDGGGVARANPRIFFSS